MQNKGNNNKDDFIKDSAGNNAELEPLLQAAKKITAAQFEAQPASADFKQKLFAQIKPEQPQSIRMKFNPQAFFGKFLKPKLLIPVTTFIVLIAVVVTSMNLFPGIIPGGDSFKRLLISPAYASDIFEVEATESDSLGITAATSFIIRAKEAVDASLLKDNISFYPEVDFDFEKLSDTEFKVTPKTSLEDKTVYKLQITAAFIAENGVEIDKNYSWAFQVKDNFKAVHTLPRNEATNVPLDVGIEVTFSHSNFTNYKEAFSITPKVEGRFETHRRTLVFVPTGLAIGQIYNVTIDKDILSLANSEEKLSEDIVFSFETSNKGDKRQDFNYFSFRSNFTEFGTGQVPILPVWNRSNTGVTNFPTTIYRFDSFDKFADAVKSKSDIPYWASASQSGYYYNTSGLTQHVQFDAELQQYDNDYNRFIVLPDELPLGHYIAVVEVDGRKTQMFLQITDIAVYTSITKTKTLVWVNDLVTKTPIEQATVRVLKTGFTTSADDDGTAVFNTNTGFDVDNTAETHEQYLVVSGATQQALVPIEARLSEKSIDTTSYWNYLYTDRPLYLPGDSIQIWGFLQDRDSGNLADKVKVSLKHNSWIDYYHNPINIADTELSIDDKGNFVGSLDLQGAKPGYYELNVELDGDVVMSRWIDVQAYEKPAYSISLKPEKRGLVLGRDTVEIDIETNFFEGTPVPGIELNYSGFGGGTVTTDSQGKAHLSLETSYAGCQYCTANTVWFTVTAKNAELGDISTSTTFRTFGPLITADIDFEASDGSSVIATTKTNHVDVDAYNANSSDYYSWKGGPSTNRPINGTVTETYYERSEAGESYDFINKIVRKKYDYKRITNNIATFEGTTDQSGEHEYSFSVVAGRSYRVDIEAFDHLGRKKLTTRWYYARGSNSNYGRTNENYSLRINSDKTQSVGFSTYYLFNLGETVPVEMLKGESRVPTDENSRFLYYTSQRGYQSHSVENDAEFTFQFKKQHVPNVYVHGVFFDGISFHVANRWWSGPSAALDPESQKLFIEVTSDKDEYQPGEQVNLDVSVKDSAGKNVRASVLLNLVDEAFYALAEDDQDINSRLYSGVGSGDLGEYQSHLYSNISEVIGGGGAEGGGCFAAGTQVAMADSTTKSIESIVEGDYVLTFDNEKSRNLVPARVNETFEHYVPGYMTINGFLKVTPVHVLFMNGEWQPVGNAKLGDTLIDQDGQEFTITSIDWTDETSTVYNLHVDTYHTYIADGVYVHNDKGAPAPRSNFEDTALFELVQTNTFGKANVQFTLPDNITSWRVTSQAISDDLQVGSAVTNINASLPAFVDVTIPRSFVKSDQPEARFRAFGKKLSSGDTVKFSMESESLGLDKVSVDGQAYKSSYFQFPALQNGEHQVLASFASGKYSDSLLHSVMISESRLTEGKQSFYLLEEGLAVDGNTDARTELVFSDKNQGRLYSDLRRLGWTWGDRVDQKLSRAVSASMRKQYFEDETYGAENVNFEAYQAEEGISLLPFSEQELALTAKAVSVAPQYFDQNSLRGYFYGFMNSKDSNQEEIIWSLVGLAGMGEPVLTQLQNMASVSDLSPMEKLQVALGLHLIGDGQRAQELYFEVMSNHGEERAPYVRVNIDGSDTLSLEATSLASVIAASLNDTQRDPLWEYVRENYSSEILTNLEELLFVQAALPTLRSGPVSFKVTIDGKTDTINLKKGQRHRVSVTSDQLSEISFSEIDGDVGLVSYFERPVKVAEASTDSSVSLSRSYYVDGQQTTTFKQDDIVEVRLSPSFTGQSFIGSYQITDILPSGLTLISSPWRRGVGYECNRRYPYDVMNQKLSFRVHSQFGATTYCPKKYISYFARVSNTGTYTAEPALIQAYKNAESKNFSQASEQITINR